MTADFDKEWDRLIAGLFAVVFFPFGWALPAWLLAQLYRSTTDSGLQFFAGVGMLLTCITPVIGVYLSWIVFGALSAALGKEIVTRGGFLLGTFAFVIGALFAWQRNGFGFPGNIGATFLWGIVPGAIVAFVTSGLLRSGIIRRRRTLLLAVLAELSALAVLILFIFGVISPP